MVTGGGRIVILGLGNVLMGDDAFGAHLLKVLEASYEFPDDVALIDAGTPGNDLFLYVEGCRAVIVVDAVKASGAPGEVRVFRGDELLKSGSSPLLSAHEPSLVEALCRLRLAGTAPDEVVLVGAIPGRTDAGTGLSNPMQTALPEAEAHVIRALEGLGVVVRKRTQRRTPDIWWEL